MVGFPEMYSRLIHGRFTPESVAADDDGADDLADLGESTSSPSLLVDLDALATTTHTHAQRAASAVVTALSFLDLFASSSERGRARLLDGACRPGPSSWLRRAPTSERFQFLHPADYVTSLCLDLMLCPPHMRDAHCLPCARASRASLIGLDGRHFVHCPHGLRLHTSVHDPVVHELIDLLDHVLGPARVLGERAGDRSALDQWMQQYGTALLHRPDVVLVGFDGPGTFTLIDVKTFDPSASSIVDHHHTSVTPRARHRELERRDTPRQYFGDAPPPPAMRLVTFVVSVFCSFGEQAQALLRTLSMRCGRSVPPTLIEESSWATPLFAPFARMSISLACRRALAAALRESVVSDPRRVAPAAPGPSDPRRSFQCACHAGVPV